MKFVRRALGLFAFIGALGLAAPVMAADAPTAGVKKPAPKDLILKGDAKCTGCHDEADDAAPSMLELNPQVLAIGKTKHGTRADSRTPTCTDCHGESEKHIGHKGSGKPPAPDRSFRKLTATPAEIRNDACMTCHKKDAKRSHWEGSTHQTRDVGCNSCHKIHTARDKVRNKLTQAEVCFTCHKEQRAQVNRPSHHPISEGKVACSDCHNSHGSAGPTLLVKDSVNRTCYECHMEKRGPFLHEHPPVMEDCSLCHNPHGTTAASLLKQRVPILCSNCHNEGSHHVNFQNRLASRSVIASGNAMGPGCLGCHTKIHGSDTTQTGNGGHLEN